LTTARRATERHDPRPALGELTATEATWISPPSGSLQVQCVVTRHNERRLEELVADLVDSRVDGMTFSFYGLLANPLRSPSAATQVSRNCGDEAERC
jgi:hypothetical protein